MSIIIIILLVIVVVVEYIICRKCKENGNKSKEQCVKLNEFYNILLRWIQVHQEGKQLTTFFRNNGYKTVAIYGMKEIGQALVDELENTDIEVKYGIDRDAPNIYVGLDLYTPDEKLPEVDVVVITAVHYFSEIKTNLENRMNSAIVSIEDVVWEI